MSNDMDNWQQRQDPTRHNNDMAGVNDSRRSEQPLNKAGRALGIPVKQPANTPLQTDAELRASIHNAAADGLAEAAYECYGLPEVAVDKLVQLIKSREASFLERALAAVGEDEAVINVVQSYANNLRAEIRTKLNQEFGGK